MLLFTADFYNLVQIEGRSTLLYVQLLMFFFVCIQCMHRIGICVRNQICPILKQHCNELSKYLNLD